MFTFGFSSEVKCDQPSQTEEKVTEANQNERKKAPFNLIRSSGPNSQQPEKDKPKKQWLPCEEIKIGNNVVMEELLQEDCSDVEVIAIEDKHKIRHVSTEIVAEMIKKRKDSQDSIFKAEINNSDLITAVYEGGLKIWQCTYDLLDYVYTQNIDFKGKNVLDLGCGAGILGLYAFINGAKVYFQDYNPEVVRYITLPNVLLNATENNEAKRCKFYSGDWKSFVEATENDFAREEEKFDYILSSETIYNCDNYPKLNLLLKERLKRDGVIFLAAKTYYFGVGGGTREFEHMLKADDVFNFDNCWKNGEGLQREILMLTFK